MGEAIRKALTQCSTVLFIVVAVLWPCSRTLGWDNKTTHKHLSKAAAGQSILAKQGYLSLLGMTEGLKTTLIWPIEGVVVFMDWQQAIFSHGHEFRDAFETLTDKEGRFSLPRYWSWNPWRWLTTESFVTIFKSGYEPIKGSRWEWMLKHEWGAPKGSIVWKIEHGRPVILLKKVEDLQKRESLLGFVGPGGDIPAEKSVLLRREKEKEHEIIFPK